MVRFKVATESHPVAEVNTAEYTPETAYSTPFHTKGTLFSQTTVSTEEESTGTTDRFKVATESHPAAELNTTE
jgi:hypothetical protein